MGGADLSVPPTDNGEGGKLAMREEAAVAAVAVGGGGKAAALIVRRTVFPAPLTTGGRGNDPDGAAAVSREGRFDAFLGSGMRDFGAPLAPEARPTREVVEELALME